MKKRFEIQTSEGFNKDLTFHTCAAAVAQVNQIIESGSVSWVSLWDNESRRDILHLSI